ncbi:MAG: cytochrome c biogenesis protein CcdA [Flavobacterium sp.]
MKRIIFVFLMLLTFVKVNSQVLDPVKWKSKVEKISDTEFNLVFEAVMEEGWHVYSQFTPDGGPLPTEVTFKEANGNFTLVGKTLESATKKQFNSDFGVDEIFFEKKAVLKQKVKITNPNVKAIVANIDYQACKEVCLNLNKKFTFTLPAITTTATVAAVTKTTETTELVSDTVTTKAIAEVATTDSEKTEVASVSTETQVPVKDEKRGLFTIFFIAFFSGFAALLTPCVFPMIPMTVSFFTKQSKTRAKGIKNAIFYGVSIILIYVLLGILVTGIFGAGALNALSTNVWFNIIFFLLLVFFASSFLGAFEIMLPNSWANKVDSQADRGGIIGILFMALALAIVSFSCTGPIVGTLLVESASKGGIAPIVGMLGFSFAIALPFMLFAMFPGWLNSLPKSGGWLNTVKVFLGFLELALAFKFLSNADLVLQLHLLEREVFIAIWIVIFGTLAYYLFGKLTLPHDSPLTHLSVGRLMMALLVSTFTIYLIPGLWGAPLKLISAFPPPMEYSESPKGVGATGGSAEASVVLPTGAIEGPHGLVVFDDYDKGLAYAKTVNKPIMLDFTGRACVNCRKMENNVWSESSVLSILKNEVVLISLYVDDKRELPKSEQTVSKVSGEIMTTIGDKWTDFMISKYNTNTQPLYVITDLEGNNLNSEIPTISYTPNVKEYESWLKAGISKFKK